MSTETPYLGLIKPDGAENVNVNTQINQNFDRMDAKTLELAGRITLVEEAFGIETEVWETFTPAWTTGVTATVAFARIRKSGTVCHFQIECTAFSFPDQLTAGLTAPYAPATHYATTDAAGFLHAFFPGTFRWAGGTEGGYTTSLLVAGVGVLGYESNTIYLHHPESGGSALAARFQSASRVLIDCIYETAP